MLLDIFIPYWGPPEYMRETVRSVLAQTDGRWRLTVIDDNYADRSIGEWIGTLDDDRVTYVRNDRNRGITENFRTSIQTASAELVAVVGCDDVLLPNYVGSILDAHREHPDATIIQPGVDVIGTNGNLSVTLADSVKRRMLRPASSSPVLLSGERLATSLLTGNWLYWPSLAFRTDRVQEYDFRDGFAVIQDLALILDMVLADETLLALPETSFRYRRHASSASVAALVDGTRFAGEREFFRLAAELCHERGWLRAERAARLHLTSRLHAVSLLPGATRRGGAAAARVLARHVFGS
jgi:glycosyltransferase involved in cell wall biosynthesis